MVYLIRQEPYALVAAGLTQLLQLVGTEHGACGVISTFLILVTFETGSLSAF